jgi:hypothetical protein
VIDQAALHGMLNHIRDLGLPLLAVDRVASGNEPPVPKADSFGDRCQEAEDE